MFTRLKSIYYMKKYGNTLDEVLKNTVDKDS